MKNYLKKNGYVIRRWWHIIEEDFDEKLKLMVLGDSNVGKSSIINKLQKWIFI